MNDTTAAPAPEQDTTNANTYQRAYHFRKIPLADYDKLLAKTPAAANVKWEAIQEDGKEYRKRESEHHTLQMPEWFQQLPANELVRGTIAEVVASFVRETYIDNYLPVGPHDWKTIEEAKAASARASGASVPSKEELETAISSIIPFMTAATGSAAAAAKLGELVRAKVTDRAIIKNKIKFEVDMLQRLQARYESWIKHVMENEPEATHEVAAKVYMYVDDMLTKHIKAIKEAEEDTSAAIDAI